MRKNILAGFVIAAVAGIPQMPAHAVVIGRAVSSADFNSTYTQDDPDYTIPGDMFGIRSTASPGSAGLPFAIEDTSPDFGDSAGIILNDSNNDGGIVDTDPFFGVVDTVNGSGNGTNVARWMFDIAGQTLEGISIDFAAMGDFESSNDLFNLTWEIDGNGANSLFSSSVDESGSLTYNSLQPGGFSTTLSDPLLMNGVTLNNVFQTLTSLDVAGQTGSVLTIEIAASADGGSEAFALRNIEVNAVPEPGTMAGLFSLSLMGLAVRRRVR
ncbi:PEP-CTERM sorting domain-containing protein [Roseiconus lacunae]|uniref:PEP-CTERM sorting domain-containing protein n=1 Tax=Roseiconus lacunae TaxID=2605694 RepID=UPI001E5AA876|nr:PEP-CTERM sorting domain-containing protein [Roseiconus lacunae]MCD0463603.1 PEP-CTERM sorting domain-containing protein [Roseiconus lacunae]